MERQSFSAIVAWGVLLNGALYLALVFVAGLVMHQMLAVYLAIAAAGLTYLNCTMHLMLQPKLAAILSFIAIAFGTAAGLALLR